MELHDTAQTHTTSEMGKYRVLRFEFPASSSPIFEFPAAENWEKEAENLDTFANPSCPPAENSETSAENSMTQA